MTPKRILIVEDQKPMARALELKLQSAGFETHVCLNGQEALEVLANERFDLMLLDIIMPKVNGFMVMDELKKRGVQILIIVTSNLSQEEDQRKALAMGALAYFIKSDTSLALLVENIKKILTP